MARSKLTARKTTGGKAKQFAGKAFWKDHHRHRYCQEGFGITFTQNFKKSRKKPVNGIKRWS